MPRLYIAHGFMRHNRMSPRLFLLRSLMFHWLIFCAMQCTVSRAAAQTPQGKSSHTQSKGTKTGVDILEQENFESLRGKRVGLITNRTGGDAQGWRTIDLLAHAPGVRLLALFSPEHGIAGRADEPIANA